MKKGINFRTQKGYEDYSIAYDKSLKLWDIPYEESNVITDYGITHYICCGDETKEPLVLLHAASCGSTIWYKNIKELSSKFRVYAIDLITESSKSLLHTKLKSSVGIAKWLDDTLTKIGLNQVYLCGLSIGGWHSANYAIHYPERVMKLILLSPIQTLSKMYAKFFIQIMKMGFNPTRENVENYIGWTGEKEVSLPDSIIEQFTISVMNVNPNSAFPKMIKKNELKKLSMQVLVLLGANEFAFDIAKAEKVAKLNIRHLEIGVIENASHLIPLSSPNKTNKRIIDFLSK